MTVEDGVHAGDRVLARVLRDRLRRAVGLHELRSSVGCLKPLLKFPQVYNILSHLAIFSVLSKCHYFLRNTRSKFIQKIDFGNAGKI